MNELLSIESFEKKTDFNNLCSEVIIFDRIEHVKITIQAEHVFTFFD